MDDNNNYDSAIMSSTLFPQKECSAQPVEVLALIFLETNKLLGVAIDSICVHPCREYSFMAITANTEGSAVIWEDLTPDSTTGR